MRLSSGTARHFICLTSLLAFASTPLLAQRGIDLLNPGQALQTLDSPVETDGAVTVRAVLDHDAKAVVQASHARRTLQYDDGKFENYAASGAGLEPASNRGMVEWAQRFELEEDSVVASVDVCFLRPTDDPNSSIDFKLRFYGNVVERRKDNPGSAGGLRYDVGANIRPAGTSDCVVVDALAGKSLDDGVHWVGVEWNTAQRKRLGGDHYTREDEADKNRNNEAVHDTEVRYRTLPVPSSAASDGWLDPRQGVGATVTTSGLKAIGVRLVVAPAHADDDGDGDDGDGDGGDGDGGDGDDGDDDNGDADPGRIVPPPPGFGYSACRPTFAPLVLEGGIKVSLCYETPDGKMDDARAVYRSTYSGLLYFFDKGNAEVLVKVLDGCRINQHRWVYVAPLTDVAFNMYINDGRSRTWTYFNRAGDQGEIRSDLGAFPCTP